VTPYAPQQDRRTYSRTWLVGRIYAGLGGRAAEEVALNDVSSGAIGDIRQVTRIARAMVTQYGMSDEIGLVDVSTEDEQPFLGYSIQRNVAYSDETLAKIDAEVKRIISESYEHVVKVLSDNRDKLDALAQELLDNEVVDRERVFAIAGLEPPDETQIVPEIQPSEEPE
jgi:cell division protease FtsH